MSPDGFDLEYSFIFFGFAFVSSMFPFGIQLYGKLFLNNFPEKTVSQIAIPYFLILTWFTVVQTMLGLYFQLGWSSVCFLLVFIYLEDNFLIIFQKRLFDH